MWRSPALFFHVITATVTRMRNAGILCWGLLLAAVAPLAGQQDAVMVGRNEVSRDFMADRGFLIAKGTTLPQGRGYVAALAPTFTLGVAYGVTDRFTVQAGTSFWTLPSGYPSGYLSIRYRIIAVPGLDLAVGALGVGVAGDGELLTGGWPYVTTTVGTDRLALSGLIGVGSSSDVFESDFDGHLLLQGLLEAVVVPHVKILVEALYLGQNSDPAGGIGARYFTRRVAGEVGFIYVFESGGGDGIPLPWAGVSVGF